jgi:hypothetical protein
MSPLDSRRRTSPGLEPSTPRSSVSSPSRSDREACGSQCRSGVFALFESAGAASGNHTQIAFDVDDLDAVVGELRKRGVVFEEVDVPGLRTVDGIATVEGNYPSKGVGERAAWFRDSEGNLVGIGQPVR